MATVRRATEGDWLELRLVRLAALADSPWAFGSSLEQEEAFDEVDWRRWASSAPIFLAYAGGASVGMVGVVDEGAFGDRRVVALWVDPAHRGRGVACALMTCVKDWAHRDGALRLTLWVARGNEAALRLYERLGFAYSGERRVLPSDAAVEEERMVLLLRSQGPGSVRDREL